MKKWAFFTGLLLLLVIACKEEIDETQNKSLMLAGISSSKGNEMVCVNLDSGNVSTTPISGYVMSSTVYDPNTGGYGYVDMDTIFWLRDAETGEIIKSIKLPGFLAQVVIDADNNILMGRYGMYTYIDDPDSINGATIPVFHNYLLRVDLESDEIITDVETDLGDGVYACNYAYDEAEEKYLMQRADKKLIWLNPSTGVTEKTVDIAKALNNMIFDPCERRVIGMTYNQGTNETSIEVYSADTGALISSCVVSSVKGIYACISGYDKETDCYIVLNSDDEVMFIKVLTGEVVKEYKLDYHLSDIQFFRR